MCNMFKIFTFFVVLFLACIAKAEGQGARLCSDASVHYGPPSQDLQKKIQLTKLVNLSEFPLSAKHTLSPQGTRWFVELDPDCGRLSISGREWKAQRAAYELLVGPFPPSSRLLHPLSPKKCIGRAYRNPAHMKQQARLSGIVPIQKRCSQGHLIDPQNSVIERRGDRIVVRCCICRRAAWRESKKTARGR